MPTAELTSTARRKSRKVPEALILECFGGRTFYRRGYREVLNGTKTLEEIRRTSGLQAEIVSYIFEIIIRSIDKKKYRVHVSEPGIHLKKGENIAGDILVFDKLRYSANKVTTNYTNLPPMVAIEVDIAIDLEKVREYHYTFDKAQTYLAFGASKVIWVLSNIQKILVFEAGREAVVYNWYADIEVLDGVKFNVGTYLDEEGIRVAS
ncbi:MAG: Uma2 family endonuclease [Cytophagaceae bacterium]|nr:Uma2 family endonuclease [Cytophagaceae bacterium]